MDDRELLQYSLDDYRAEMDECDRLYSRAALYLGGVPVIGAIGYALGSEVGVLTDAIGWVGCVAWLAMITCGLTLASAFFGGVCLGIAVKPREYHRNLLPSKILGYRADYAKILDAAQYPEEHRAIAQAMATQEMMISEMSDRVTRAYGVNQRRQFWIRIASWALLFSMAATGTSAVLALTIKLTESTSNRESKNGGEQQPTSSSTSAASTST